MPGDQTLPSYNIPVLVWHKTHHVQCVHLNTGKKTSSEGDCTYHQHEGEKKAFYANVHSHYLRTYVCIG